MVSTKRLSARTRSPRENGSERRAELLAIAGELFATRGFLATTVRDIAEAAGILSGSLYHHFDSKEAMVDEILREFLDDQRQANAKIIEEAPDPRTALTELIKRSYAALRKHPAAIAIFQNEANYLAQFERFDYLPGVADEFEKTWLRVLQEGQKTGVFREDLNLKLTYRFIRDTVWTTVHWYNPNGKLSIKSIADQYINILCDGIVTR
ncbi:TetR/AcrR family transcriptional regulator [Saccharopolyspora rhizosphaerae]|uniref:TetR/AcrR family transcriptional regulator n=1 Tax=Saccharopolyspora rhizosphaerae TaxID=2492662 RepID=A0A3R8Q3A6_9PSEU|nr:TetR/AcrR family transcriptional regulator [Saccharopolyspora rhizosphaerae]RRO17570.1 TetR/AcrR family transcriptional regulator [Saccharopolyspora rhizosphaerae]